MLPCYLVSSEATTRTGTWSRTTPEAVLLIDRVQPGNLAGIRGAETERRAGAPVSESGNPAALFQAEHRLLDDSTVVAALRFTRRVLERMQELVTPLAPVVLGGALIIPQGLLDELQGRKKPATFARETRAVEKVAMDAVTEAERQLGFEPHDVSSDNLGCDIESRDPRTGTLRFIEVEGRARDATTVTVTKNEILTALNRPESFILALVEVDSGYTICRYLSRPFEKEPDFGVTNVNYSLWELWNRGEVPR